MAFRDDVIDILIRLRRLPKFRKDAMAAQRAIEGVSDEVDEARRHTLLYSRSNDRLGSSFRNLRNTLRDLIKTHKEHKKAIGDTGDILQRTNTVFAFFRNLLRTLAIPIAIASFGLLAQSISVLLGGVTALVAALGPLSGYLLALPGAVSAVGQAVSIWNFAFSDMTQALGGSAAALDRLTTSGLGLFVALNRLKPLMLDIRSATQDAMFPGIEKGINSMLKNIGVVRGIATSTGTILGRLAAKAGNFLGSKGFGQDLQKIASTNNQAIWRLGNALIRIFKGVVDITVAARPLLMYMTKLSQQFAIWFQRAAHAGRESGRLNLFFRRTAYTTDLLIKLFKNFGGAILNIGKIAAPFGRQILRDLGRASERFNMWTQSARGQNEIKKYFQDIMPALYEMGRLLRDAVKLFFHIGRAEGLTPLLKQIRTEFLPLLADLVPRMTEAFGPAMIDALSAMLRLFGQLSEETGPLTVLLKLFALMGNTLAGWMEANPILRHTVTALLLFNGTMKITFFLVKVLTGGFKKLAAAWATTKKIVDLLRGSIIAKRIQLGLLWAQEKILIISTKIWAAANRILALSMLGIPVVAIVAGIIALGAAFVIAYKKIGWFRNAVDWTWNILKGIGRWIINHWPIVLGVLTGGLVPAAVLFVKNFGKIKSAVRDSLGWIEDRFNGFIGFIKTVPGALASAGAGMFSWLKNAFKNAYNFVARAWNSLALEFELPGVLKKLPGPDRVRIGTPRVPLLQYGGHIVRSGAAVVGDAGPELLNLPAGAMVRPLSSPARLSSTAVNPIFSRSEIFNNNGPEVIQLVVDGKVLAETTNRANSDQKARE